MTKLSKIRLTPPDAYEPYNLSRAEAERLVDRLEPGHHIYTHNGYIVTLTEIERKRNTLLRFKFWYETDKEADTDDVSRTWACWEGMVKRFMKFGPIDNDPIIIHEERPMERRISLNPQPTSSAKPEPQQKAVGTESKPDMVNSPSHYTTDGIECIEAIKASMTPEAFNGYLKGNVMKYMWRYEKKINPVEDLKKAHWYQDRLIKELSDAQ